MPLHNSPLRLLAVVLLPLTLLAACDTHPEEPPAKRTITPETFAQEYADALCKWAGTCGNLAPYEIDACKAQANERIQPEDVKKAIAAGRLVYDEEQAVKCIEGIENTRCLVEDLSDEVLAACYAAVQGTVQKGGQCSFLFECAAGTCGGTEDTTCPATCPTDVLGEGESCSLFRGPRCDARAGLRCSGGTCIRPMDKGASCIDNFGCKSGLLCVEDKCEPLHKEGQGCSEDGSCEPGLYCEGTCEVRKREGAQCALAINDVDAALRGAQCLDGLVCKGAGLDFEGNTLSGSCAKPSAEGGPCQTDPQNVQIYVSGCQTGLLCVDGTCALPPSSGACSPDGSCRSDQAYCSRDNVCLPLKPNGADCAIPPECASRNCFDGKCAPQVVYCHE